MSDPKNNVGKIFKSLEKFFDPRAGKIKVKSRPVLVVGYERNATSHLNIDYELLPISKLENTDPDPEYDLFISNEIKSKLGLTQASYIRTHKTTWNHCKHMTIDSPIGDLKGEFPSMFEKTLKLNEKWVCERNSSKIIKDQEIIF